MRSHFYLDKMKISLDGDDGQNLFFKNSVFSKLRPISLKNYSRPKLKSGFNEEWFSWQITNLMDLHSKTHLYKTSISWIFICSFEKDILF